MTMIEMVETRPRMILPTMMLDRTSIEFRHDKRTEERRIHENIIATGKSMLVLDAFPCKDDSCDTCYRQIEEAKKITGGENDFAGQLHAEQVLTQSNEIPEEWKRYYLVFAGTIWVSSGGSLCVPYLYCLSSRWDITWFWLGQYFGSRDRLVRFQSLET